MASSSQSWRPTGGGGGNRCSKSFSLTLTTTNYFLSFPSRNKADFISHSVDGISGSLCLLGADYTLGGITFHTTGSLSIGNHSLSIHQHLSDTQHHANGVVYYGYTDHHRNNIRNYYHRGFYTPCGSYIGHTRQQSMYRCIEHRGGPRSGRV